MADWMKWRTPNTEMALSLRFSLPNNIIHLEQLPALLDFHLCSRSVPMQITLAHSRHLLSKRHLFLNGTFWHVETLTLRLLRHNTQHYTTRVEINGDWSQATSHSCNHNAFHQTSKQGMTLNWGVLAQNRNQILLE